MWDNLKDEVVGKREEHRRDTHEEVANWIHIGEGPQERVLTDRSKKCIGRPVLETLPASSGGILALPPAWVSGRFCPPPWASGRFSGRRPHVLPRAPRAPCAEGVSAVFGSPVLVTAPFRPEVSSWGLKDSLHTAYTLNCGPHSCLVSQRGAASRQASPQLWPAASWTAKKLCREEGTASDVRRTVRARRVSERHCHLSSTRKQGQLPLQT